MLDGNISQCLDVDIPSYLHLLLSIGKNDGLYLILSVSLSEAADNFIILEGGKLRVDVVHSNVDVLISAQCSLIVSEFHSNAIIVDCFSVGDISARNSFFCCLDWLYTYLPALTGRLCLGWLRL